MARKSVTSKRVAKKADDILRSSKASASCKTVAIARARRNATLALAAREDMGGAVIEIIAVLICRAFHRGVFFGGGSSYTCSVCMRRYQTPWASRIEPGVYV